MRIDTIQTSFVGGEFGPSLFGRTDISQYANACAIVENMLIRPFGSAISTPGTELISAAKTGGSTSVVKLMSFVFSRTDAYVIEMGVGYFRFYTDGSLVLSGGTTPYEVSHTYTASEIPEIQYCQLNDVIFISHANHKTAKLIRLSASSWTLTDLAVIGGPFQPDNTTSTTITSSVATSGATTQITASSGIFVPSTGSSVNHVGSYWKIGSTVTNATTGLAVQGYVRLDNVVTTQAATGTVMSLLSTTGATSIWAEGSWSAYRGYPGRNTFFQQRLFLARTAQEPQNIWGSKSFVFENFAVDGGADDDAINIQLASNESNDIKWLLGGRDLIAGTFGGEFRVGTGDGSALTPATTNVTKQTSWGSESIIPKIIGRFVYYIQRFGKKLRELFFDFDTVDGYRSVDRTILSPHIVGTNTTDRIIDIAYQQNPDTVLWCVCTNGTIATMTREVDQEVVAWSRQTTDGFYESIASIPSQDSPHDEIWVVVKRTIGGVDYRYIERFKSQEVPNRQDQCFYVHSGLNYNAYDLTTTGINDYSNLNNVKLLLALNGNTTDTSGTSKTVTNSNVTFSSVVAKFSSSALFNGTNAYLTTADSADWNFGSGDFTIDTWFNLSDISTEQSFFSQSTDANNWMTCGWATLGRIDLEITSASAYIGRYRASGVTITAGVWYHLAVVRSGSNLYIFIDGVAQGVTIFTDLGSGSIPDFTNNLYIGAFNLPGTGIIRYLNGYLDQFRVIKGTALYTTSFNPPIITSSVNMSVSATTGTSVLATTSSAYFSSNDVGQRIRSIDSNGNTTGELRITGYTSSTIVVGNIISSFSAPTSTGGMWGVSVEQIQGISHLEGKDVTVLADGGTDGANKTVSSGTINLNYDYFVVNVGLPYTQKLKTLVQEAGAQRGTAQGKIQRINQVGFKVNRSFTGFEVGGSEAMLQQVYFRNPQTNMGSPEALYTGLIPNITFNDDYRYGSQVLIHNTKPLPIELLNVITSIDTNEK